MKKENPAKTFLRRYIAISGRIDALQMAITKAMERAFNMGVTLKEVKVLSSPSEHDPMASDVCSAIDACEILYKEKEMASHALREIMDAIDSVPDETQKQILVMRYVSGMPFPEIMEKMHYEKSQIFLIHGRALLEINKWLISNEDYLGSKY